jgi:uncharacterized damage-inducible protein DinB
VSEVGERRFAESFRVLSLQRQRESAEALQGKAKGANVKEHFVLMAEYNAWANTRLYGMAARLTDEQYRRDVSAYFGSLHGTLNHLLVTDRIWLHRLTGTGVAPKRLSTILYGDLAHLTAARRVEDERLVGHVQNLSGARLDASLEHRKGNGGPRPKVREVLAHVFNHQTHHRGQAHTIVTILGVKEPESLDLLAMLRQRAAR